MSRSAIGRVVAILIFFMSFQFASASNRASLCRVGVTFKKFDSDVENLEERFTNGSTLASDPALCQPKNGELFAVVRFNARENQTTFLVIRGNNQIDRAREVLANNGYSF